MFYSYLQCICRKILSCCYSGTSIIKISNKFWMDVLYVVEYQIIFWIIGLDKGTRYLLVTKNTFWENWLWVQNFGSFIFILACFSSVMKVWFTSVLSKKRQSRNGHSLYKFVYRQYFSIKHKGCYVDFYYLLMKIYESVSMSYIDIFNHKSAEKYYITKKMIHFQIYFFNAVKKI